MGWMCVHPSNNFQTGLAQSLLLLLCTAAPLLPLRLLLLLLLLHLQLTAI